MCIRDSIIGIPNAGQPSCRKALVVGVERRLPMSKADARSSITWQVPNPVHQPREDAVGRRLGRQREYQAPAASFVGDDLRSEQGGFGLPRAHPRLDDHEHRASSGPCGHHSIGLEVLGDNRAAIALYEKSGFARRWTASLLIAPV